MYTRHLFSILFVVSFSSFSQAYLSLAETADIPSQDQLIFGAYPQIFLNRGGGANVGGFADIALAESFSVRGHFEVGKIDTVLGASVKFTPFPDIDRQPAIGFRGGFTYARDSDENFISTHIAVLLSKKVPTDQGTFNPYVGIPLTFTSMKDGSESGTQFIVGSEYFDQESSPIRFGGEIGISLKDSYSYILGYITYSIGR
ncbi:MAG: hypothetical protein ACK5WZ_02740 [Pseudobdellovibrionaceae bacterium]